MYFFLLKYGENPGYDGTLLVDIASIKDESR
jgi:hypothetical protein